MARRSRPHTEGTFFSNKYMTDTEAPRTPPPDPTQQANVTDIPSPRPEGTQSGEYPNVRYFVLSNEVFSDSGYGSGGGDLLKIQDQRKSNHLQSIRGSHELASGLNYNPTERDTGEEHTVAGTVYSDTESLRNPRMKDYVSEFAEELCSAIPREFDAQDIAKLSQSLPNLLKDFAIKLGNEGDTPIHKLLMYFVHQYHKQIIGHIHRIYALRDEDDDERSQSDAGIGFEDKVSFWLHNTTGRGLDNPEGPPYDGHDSDDDFYDADDMTESDLPGLSEYRAILHHAPAYRWLLARVRTEGLLEIPGEDTARDVIRDYLLRAMGRPKRISRKTSPDRHKVRFEVDWNPCTFFHEQQYTQSPSEIIVGAITLTGSGDNVQAATCLQYLDQTWPETGSYLLKLLQRLLDSRGIPPTITLPDKTQLRADFIDSRLNVVVSGNVYSVVEVGEQLAWLGAALRSSSLDHGVVYCKATINESARDSLIGTQEVYKIGFNFVATSQDYAMNQSSTNPGTCWHSLFRNPVVVTGYPIPRRSKPNSGLLIPLDMMATLTNAHRLVEYCGRTFVKGFSAFLAATEIVGDTVFWHLFFNTNGEYISYEDPRVPRVQETPLVITTEALERSRHILGWCQQVNNYTGAPSAKYKIDWSCLPKPHQSCAFEKVSISGGRYISAGVSIALGIKDKPVHIHFGDDYNQMLSVIGQRHFVFYDVKDRRAWLVDGASGLLHLLRASIRELRSEYEVHSRFLLNDDQFEEAVATHTGSSAARSFLFNENNKNLRLYVKSREEWLETTAQLNEGNPEEVTKAKVTYFCVRNRVEQICNILAQMMAHQDDVHTQAGVGFRLQKAPLQQLEGFDFKDVATNQGTLWPKVSTLHQMGAGWTEFTRAIHALTFFGTGFGELFQPADRNSECSSCLWNHSVPKGQDYLVACTAELEHILKRNGNIKTQPWRLIDKIYWHTPGKAFEPCECPSNSSFKHDRIQLLSTTFPKLPGQCVKSPEALAPNGAVIFGHKRKLSSLWLPGDDRDKRSDDSLSAEYDDTKFYDSGIGTSPYTSSAMARNSSADATSQGATGSHQVYEQQERLSGQQPGEASSKLGEQPDSVQRPKGMLTLAKSGKGMKVGISSTRRNIKEGFKGKQIAASPPLPSQNQGDGEAGDASKLTTRKRKEVATERSANSRWRENTPRKWFQRLKGRLS
ncbi:hypothetical protein F4810DRAFT_668607 [Camillea tinctor]|nr:hypothetical protein F4810DRAFT_668607 [Camillea tinctor]